MCIRDSLVTQPKVAQSISRRKEEGKQKVIERVEDDTEWKEDDTEWKMIGRVEDDREWKEDDKEWKMIERVEDDRESRGRVG